MIITQISRQRNQEHISSLFLRILCLQQFKHLDEFCGLFSKQFFSMILEMPIIEMLLVLQPPYQDKNV